MTRASWLHTIPLVTIVVVGMAGPAFAQDDAFKEGMQAKARNPPDWKQVEAHMRKAIAADPTDSTRMVGRNLIRRGDPYVPHFFLGEALFRQDRCAEALAEWEISEKAGVAGRRDELLKIMQDGSAQCEARGVLPAAKLGPAVQAAGDAVRTAASSAEDVRLWADAHPEFWNASADLRTRNQSAVNELAQARSAVSAGTTNRRQQDLENARRLAANAEKLFRSVRGEAERRVKEAAGASANFDQALQAAYAKASDLDAAIKQAASVSRAGDPAIGEDHRRAVQLLREVQDQMGAAAAAERPLADALRRVREADGVLNGARAKLDELVRAAKARELQALATNGPALFLKAEESLTTIAQAVADKVLAPDVRAKIQSDIDRSRRDLERAPDRLKDAFAKSDLVEAQNAVRVAAIVHRRLEDIVKLVGPLDGLLASFAVPDAVRSAAQLFFDARYQDAITALTDELAASSGRHAVHVHTLRAAALFALHEYGGRKDDALLARARADAQAARALDPAFAPNPAAFSPRFITFFQGSDR